MVPFWNGIYGISTPRTPDIGMALGLCNICIRAHCFLYIEGASSSILELNANCKGLHLNSASSRMNTFENTLRIDISA